MDGLSYSAALCKREAIVLGAFVDTEPIGDSKHC